MYGSSKTLSPLQPCQNCTCSRVSCKLPAYENLYSTVWFVSGFILCQALVSSHVNVIHTCPHPTQRWMLYFAQEGLPSALSVQNYLQAMRHNLFICGVFLYTLGCTDFRECIRGRCHHIKCVEGVCQHSGCRKSRNSEESGSALISTKYVFCKRTARISKIPKKLLF